MAKREEPFASAPARPGKFVLWFKRGEREEIHIFAAMYAAKKFVEEVLKGDDWVLDGDRFLRSRKGIKVRVHLTCTDVTLREVMGHEYTRSEDLWDLPVPYVGAARSLREGPTVERVVLTQGRAPKKAVIRAGLVTIQDIADELGMSGRDARSVVRKAKWEKPECGWAWKAEEADKVRTFIRKQKYPGG